MTWIWISLLVWLALSPVVALFVGRAVTIAEKHRTTHRSRALRSRAAGPAGVA